MHRLFLYPPLLNLLPKQTILPFFKHFRPVIPIPFTTSTSNPSLPFPIKTPQHNLPLPKPITSFLQPLPPTINIHRTPI
ncbi:cation:dicarboxylate symporter family transporter, partial [Bacillus thuringiensis]|uniref:cation:dicarboxylate symporter family transporter n=1 Tax=Bacillus thuringiensis TaxID=1428 RepID=UPI003BFA71BF